MQKNLVIVESPAKAKTIEKFLGKDFKVMSSYGHIRDLKKRELSIDDRTLEPEYEIPEEKAKLVAAGTPIEDADILIASIALVNGFQVATGNIRHFSRFEGLDLLVW